MYRIEGEEDEAKFTQTLVGKGAHVNQPSQSIISIITNNKTYIGITNARKSHKITAQLEWKHEHAEQTEIEIATPRQREKYTQ